MDNRVIYIVYFVFFCLMMIGIGFWGQKERKAGRDKSDVEYFLGGKVTPVIVMAMSYCAASVSAGSFIGDPALISTVGWPYYWFTVFSVPGLVIPGIFLIRKLRLQSEKYGSLTITDYIGARFQSDGIKLYMSVVMVICYLFMLVSQYKGAAILLEMYTGVSFNAGLVIMMVLVVFFVNMGGLRSVAWTSFWQGCFMVVLSLSLVLVSLIKIGGFTGLESSLAAKAPELLTIYHTGENAVIPWYAIPCIFLFGFFVMFSQPYISSRYLGLESIDRKKIGTFLLITLVAGLIFNSMVMMGLAGRVFFPDAEADYLTITMSTTFFPPLISGIMMIGFFSAIISTASSILLVMGQSLGKDIFAQIYKRATPKQVVWVTQASVILIALFVLLFNYVKTPPLLQIFVLLSLTGVGSMLAMPLYAGVLWSKARREGVWCSAIAGPASYLIMTYVFDMSWAVSMGLCVVPAAIGMFGVSALLNKIVGVDQELYDLSQV